MKLSRLKVENYRRLQDFEIYIRSHLVLVGANNAGKSSLLRAIDLTLGASVAQLYASLSAEDLRDITEPLIVEIDLAGLSDDEKALFPEEFDVVTETLTVQLRAEVDDNGTVSIRREAPHGGTGRQLSRDQINSLGWKLLSATGQSRDLREGRQNPVDQILRTLELGEEKETFLSASALFQRGLNASTVLTKLRGRLADQLSRALPQEITTDNLIFVSGAQADDHILSDVRLQVTKAGNPRDLSEQSDGTRALYAVALYDLMNDVSNVMGIDEPEIHLHPTSQRSLARLLRESRTQKVIATHSPDIVSAFDISDVVVVRPGGEIAHPHPALLSTADSTLVRWWMRDRLEPLTSARIVTVEGLSDRILLEHVAEITDRSLDRLGVSVVESEGNAQIKAITRLFGPDGFKIPVSRLIDADAKGKIAAVLEVADYKKLPMDVLETELKKHSVHISENDLEDEYVSALGPTNVLSALKSSGYFSTKKFSELVTKAENANLTTREVTDFCRKEKVLCVLAILPFLTRENAPQIKSIEALLNEIAA